MRLMKMRQVSIVNGSRVAGIRSSRHWWRQ